MRSARITHGWAHYRTSPIGPAHAPYSSRRIRRELVPLNASQGFDVACFNISYWSFLIVAVSICSVAPLNMLSIIHVQLILIGFSTIYISFFPLCTLRESSSDISDSSQLWIIDVAFPVASNRIGRTLHFQLDIWLHSVTATGSFDTSSFPFIYRPCSLCLSSFPSYTPL